MLPRHCLADRSNTSFYVSLTSLGQKYPLPGQNVRIRVDFFVDGRRSGFWKIFILKHWRQIFFIVQDIFITNVSEYTQFFFHFKSWNFSENIDSYRKPVQIFARFRFSKKKNGFVQILQRNTQITLGISIGNVKIMNLFHCFCFVSFCSNLSPSLPLGCGIFFVVYSIAWHIFFCFVVFV